MNQFLTVSYALQRQQIAVERTLGARTEEQCRRAARWAEAWHKLVQRKLDQAYTPRQRSWPVPARAALRTLH
ncbi:hypothetical protein HSX11_10935 [Oxalobacteraceae bacterium]|nr:hypothetical protein [Oxalobacteraceae bacterium]